MKKDILDKAEQIIKERRVAALSECEHRDDEIRRCIPEISEIKHNLFKMSADIALRGKNYDISEVMKTVKEAGEYIKNLLIQHGYPSDYLEIHYCCSACCDKGYTADGKRCECLNNVIKKICAEEMKRSSNVKKLSSFDTFSLNYYSGSDRDVMQRCLERAVKFSESFGNHHESILMTGNTGLGKTHLSLAIGNAVSQKGYAVIYDTASGIIDRISKEHFRYELTEETLSAVIETDLLIIDDLGTEFTTSYNISTVFNIINARLNADKPTIISTNLSISEIARTYGERVGSRLLTNYTCMQFLGHDIRLQKRKQEFG